jgi:hypothetical protein
MRFMSPRLLAVIALTLTALFASSTDARRSETATPEDGVVFKRLTNEQKPDGIEMRIRNDQIVGVTVVRKGGSRMPLKQQSNPVEDTGCPSGRPKVCWEDEAKQMSVCTCEPRAATHFRLLLQ